LEQQQYTQLMPKKKIIIINHRDSKKTREANNLWQKAKQFICKYSILALSAAVIIVVLYFALVISLFLLGAFCAIGLVYYLYLKFIK